MKNFMQDQYNLLVIALCTHYQPFNFTKMVLRLSSRLKPYHQNLTNFIKIIPFSGNNNIDGILGARFVWDTLYIVVCHNSYPSN